MKKRVLCLLLALAMMLGMAACKKSKEIEAGETLSDEKVTYTVRVLNPSGMAIANVGVYIYEDDTKAELEFYNATNEAGEISFEADKRDSYVAVLADVPDGLKAEEMYLLTDLTTEIRLSAGIMTEDTEITYKLGDRMLDFTVTDTDGNQYSLYKLLEQKQAVILNFYYNGCVPCQMEFPYLQEAYEMYGDQVQFIAMNHMDKEADIAAFKKEHELTFPFAACEEKWKDVLNLTAYPTTVVIDRYGNIVLLHVGGIESAQQAKDVCAAVTGEDYVQKIYQNIEEIETTAEEGTVENPALMGAKPRFELTIEGGKEHYIEFLKLNKLTMQIKDKDAYVLYNGKKYLPNEKGIVSLLVTCPDMNTPVKIGFGNSSDETKTFVVTMSAQPGSLGNPYNLELGENKATVAKGNDQGVYFIWTAKENGTLRSTCVKASSGVKYDCTLYNLNSYAQRNISEDGNKDAEGRKYVEIKVNKGDKVQMIAAVTPDESWNYPGGSFTYLVEFTKGDGRGQNATKNMDFSVTVTDEKGKAVPNVKFATTLDEETVNFSSNEEGVAKVSLPEGSYQVVMTLPDGYTAKTKEFLLTKEAPNYTVKLSPVVIEMVDYTVVVKNVDEEVLANVTVVIGTKFATTDANGKAVFNLEKGAYTAVITAPEGYVTEDGYAFAENATQLTVVLEYALGTEKNPIDIYEMEYTTDPIAAGKGLCYNLYRLSGLIMTVNDADAKITIGEKVYTANADGKVILTVPASGDTMTPVSMKLENTGAETELYTITLEYPLGHRMNPEVLTQLGEITTELAVGSTNGYYYSWTTAEEGVVTFYLKSAPESMPYDLVLMNTTNSAVRLYSEDNEGGFVTLNVSAGDTVLINPTVMDTVQSQGVQFVSVGSFTAQENTDVIKYTYSVVVKDAEGNPMENVAVTIGNTQLTTDENGLAYAQLAEGTYTAKITVPTGYKAEKTQMTLDVVENQAQFKLTAVTMVDYTVKVTLDNAAYTGEVKVQIQENGVSVYEKTVTNGQVTANLPEGSYTVKLVLADNKLIYDANAAKLTTAKPSLTIALSRPKTYTDYKVTVLDATEKPVSGLLVKIMSGTTMAGSGTTDANGLCTVNLETGSYTVELAFEGTTYYYNKQTAVLSGNAATLTIRLAKEVNTSNNVSHWIVSGRIFKISEGTTHIKLGTGKAYAYADGDESFCIFAFEPTRLGVYSIGVDYPGMEVREYGTVIANVLGRSTQFEDGTLHYEMKEQSQLDNKLYMLFAVQNIEGVSDVCVTITRIGEPGFSMENLPINTKWYSGYTPTKQSTPSGTVKYIDIKAATDNYNIYYDEAAKEYKIMVNGVAKTLYMNLGKVTTQNVSLNLVVNGDGVAGGSPLRKYLRDSNGNIIAKEEYTDLIRSYIENADSKYGLYRVTKDLAYVVQNAKPGWWDVTSPDYLLTDCNPELGWLFACCYMA